MLSEKKEHQLQLQMGKNSCVPEKSLVPDYKTLDFAIFIKNMILKSVFLNDKHQTNRKSHERKEIEKKTDLFFEKSNIEFQRKNI